MSAGPLRKALYAASASAVRTKLPTTTKIAAKNAPSAYLLFTKDERPKLGSEFKGGPDIMKELGKRWSGLDDAARKPYVDQALKLKSELKSAPGEEITVLKAVSTEAGLTTLASNASSAAIQGFFSGLTKLSGDELKDGKTGTIKIKDTGRLKVVRKDNGEFEVTFTPASDK
mmetsp:Transcript_19419/g.48879  ORF Transcript_19419/g.48879 Transcript_19419/m.48879 type:complete len:172 (-) Transcript_19419:311-826(-)